MVDFSAALASVNGSLLDRVTPGLRGVSFLLNDTSLRVRWMYEDSPDDWLRELVLDAETECIAELWQTPEVIYEAEHLPIEKDRTIAWPVGEHWVFLRYEPSAHSDGSLRS